MAGPQVLELSFAAFQDRLEGAGWETAAAIQTDSLIWDGSITDGYLIQCTTMLA